MPGSSIGGLSAGKTLPPAANVPPPAMPERRPEPKTKKKRPRPRKLSDWGIVGFAGIQLVLLVGICISGASNPGWFVPILLMEWMVGLPILLIGSVWVGVIMTRNGFAEPAVVWGAFLLLFPLFAIGAVFYVIAEWKRAANAGSVLVLGLLNAGGAALGALIIYLQVGTITLGGGEITTAQDHPGIDAPHHSTTSDAGMQNPRQTAPGGAGENPNDGGQIGYEQALRQLLSSHDPLERRSALDALIAVAPEDVSTQEDRNEIVAAFEATATDTKVFPPDRAKAMEALAKWRGTECVPLLLALLDGGGNTVRRAAYKCLAELQDERAIAPVAARFDELSERDAVLACLVAFGPKAEDAAMQILERADFHNTDAAVELLGKIGTKKSLPALVALRDHEDVFFFQGALEEAIAAIQRRDLPDSTTSDPGVQDPGQVASGDAGENSNDPGQTGYEQMVQQMLYGRNTFDRGDALKALAAVAPEDVASQEARTEIAAAFEKMASDTEASPQNRIKATAALVKWSGKDCVPFLIELLDDTWVKEAAYKSLAELQDERAIAPVAARFDRIGEGLYVAACLEAFGPKAEDAVMQLLQGADFHNMGEVVALLGRIGTKKSLRTLVALRKTEDVFFFKGELETAIAAIQQREQESQREAGSANDSSQ